MLKLHKEEVFSSLERRKEALIQQVLEDSTVDEETGKMPRVPHGAALETEPLILGADEGDTISAKSIDSELAIFWLLGLVPGTGTLKLSSNV